MHLFRRRREAQPSPDEKPYRVTIHAEGDQYHTYAMGPGDAIGVAGIRVDIDEQGGIHARPNEAADPNLDESPFQKPKFESITGGGRTYA